MADASTFSINEFMYTMPDLTNINIAAFIATTSLHKLNNVCYPHWKAFVKSYFEGQDLWDILDESEKMQTEEIVRTK